jgi:hypothetical protein
MNAAIHKYAISCLVARASGPTTKEKIMQADNKFTNIAHHQPNKRAQCGSVTAAVVAGCAGVALFLCLIMPNKFIDTAVNAIIAVSNLMLSISMMHHPPSNVES